MQVEKMSPQGLWTEFGNTTQSQVVRCGEMIFVSGQLDVDHSGKPLHSGDLRSEMQGAVSRLSTVLGAAGLGLKNVTKILCVYVNDGSRDEHEVLSLLAEALPPVLEPAVTAIPVPYLVCEGASVMLDVYGMAGKGGSKISRQSIQVNGATPLPAGFATAVRCGKMIFVSGQSPVSSEGVLLHPGDIVAQTREIMAHVRLALEAAGADLQDVVKINRWYAGHGSVEDFEPAALACAANFVEPGPAATGIPIPRLALEGQMVRIEVVAMRNEDGGRLPRRSVWPDSLWDWTVDLPYWHGLKCHDMIFLGGQVSLDIAGRAVNPHDMRAQAAQAMVHIGSILRELGASYANICKLTTQYAGQPGKQALEEHMRIRAGFFNAPGPASTNIVLPVLAYPGMIIEIDAFAQCEPDLPVTDGQ
jgi:enamine deaminase RidA (YjgF/YER057c/UK114 family)